ncbi:MAG: hypothetical protein ABI416_20235 [Ginsengibacter sp.]
MRKSFVLVLAGVFYFASIAEAQVGIYMRPRIGYGRGFRHRPQRPPQRNLLKFQPSVNISFGYGFPNLDKNQLPDFYNLYKGTTASQTGPITGAVDYRFARNMSIGVLVTHGNTSVPYYNYNEPAAPVFTGALENWSVMLNFMRYIQATDKIAPYLRTAIGINSWQQSYTDGQGNKVNMDGVPSQLAYQLGLGANFYLAKNAGLFLEAGYGKYLLHGGFTLKF